MEPLRQAVLVIQLQLHIRSHTHNGNMRQLLQHLNTGIQNGLISTEFIDDETFYHFLFFFGKKHHRPYQLGKNAAPVDVAHQKHRSLCHFGHPHIDQIVFLEIDLRRTARSLDNDDIVLCRQMIKGFLHLRDQLLFKSEIFSRRHISKNFSVYDNLRAHIVGWF